MTYFRNFIKKIVYDRRKGRQIEVFSSDIFITSYPKSGNTWLRFLLGNIIFDDFNFTNKEQLIPNIHINSNKHLKKKSTERRILKSHEYFDPRYKKTIHIVRDPRSVFISYFEYLKKIKKIDLNSNHDDFIDSFIQGDTYIDPYGNWIENVGSWIGAKKESNDFLLIKYEDLKKNTAEKLAEILTFINIDYTDEQINDSIYKSSFESMKKNENNNKSKIKEFKNFDKNLPFVRKGSINEWETALSKKNQNKIIAKFGSLMSELGYI